jgi:hypothetical protein
MFVLVIDCRAGNMQQEKKYFKNFFSCNNKEIVIPSNGLNVIA